MLFHLELAQKVGAVILPNLGGFVGASLYPAKGPWYDGLKKSRLTPPNWVFPVAWTSLYCGMGYASFLVWRDGDGFGGNAKLPLALYSAQLIMNWAWTPLFFGAHNMEASIADLALMIPTAAGCAFTFLKINKTAGWLMAPYVLWLCFASYLNIRTYQLNKNEIQESKSQ